MQHQQSAVVFSERNSCFGLHLRHPYQIYACMPRLEAPRPRILRASCPAAAAAHYSYSERTVSSRSCACRSHRLHRPNIAKSLTLSATNISSCQKHRYTTNATAADAPAGPSVPYQQPQQQPKQQPQQPQQPQQKLQEQQQQQQQQGGTAEQMLTCRRCFQHFSSAANDSRACSFHPAMYTGGEVAKAIGFVRASSAPEHQLGAVVGRTGLMRFWDCCGAADESASGCVQGFHICFDDDVNAANGWKE